MSPDSPNSLEQDSSKGGRRMSLFAIWLSVFYCAWLILVSVGDHWKLVTDHWPIAFSMAVGSYFAGSTPMGGGTIGFPVLVLLFNEPASLGRDFSFAIQSVGMVSAAIFICCRRQPLEATMLRWAMLGSLVGTPLGIGLIAPHIPSIGIKVLFAIIWASFGVLHFWKLNEISSNCGIVAMRKKFDQRTGLAVGFIGGAFAASITGVGVDMLIYSVLVLVCRADLKIAIPTSVILMAFTSVVGLCSRHLMQGLEPSLFGNWLAAAPVVVIGAPLGAWIVSHIGRKPTLLIVSFLCVGQFVWTGVNEWEILGVKGILLALLGVAIFNIAFLGLYKLGDKLKRAK